MATTIRIQKEIWQKIEYHLLSGKVATPMKKFKRRKTQGGKESWKNHINFEY